ncbi:MAG: SEC-C metal-binding domain-containing protein [candidate division KSB1 bacterium]|nr:SEC-C metal-binding domain-containing protein [candidate division KSB1 bacterium]MDZ7303318.1 SEC-C metal-binding domain-containing protein [candidate division KSB1 bacterium]MDZ7310432.1 SEC-C metal-binding domain-containing protein [candidate division KSB1 bacterium]
MGKTRLNDPCPCGSGKKYRFCCHKVKYQKISPPKITAHFTLDNGQKISQPITPLDSIPTHNKNGLTPDITTEQMMNLCLDQIFGILQLETVGMTHDLVDRVVREMDIVPTFTYRQISERMTRDGRFEVCHHQICSLRGTDPVSLLAEKLAG